MVSNEVSVVTPAWTSATHRSRLGWQKQQNPWFAVSLYFYPPVLYDYVSWSSGNPIQIFWYWYKQINELDSYATSFFIFVPERTPLPYVLVSFAVPTPYSKETFEANAAIIAIVCRLTAAAVSYNCDDSSSSHTPRPMIVHRISFIISLVIINGFLVWY